VTGNYEAAAVVYFKAISMDFLIECEEYSIVKNLNSHAIHFIPKSALQP
jgi:hypothetical protein